MVSVGVFVGDAEDVHVGAEVGEEVAPGVAVGGGGGGLHLQRVEIFSEEGRKCDRWGFGVFERGQEAGGGELGILLGWKPLGPQEHVFGNEVGRVVTGGEVGDLAGEIFGDRARHVAQPDGAAGTVGGFEDDAFAAAGIVANAGHG
ncbi:MAG TPA: hypothetical protein VH253_17005 [Phycisphaerae bacterium]|nr:hypothetical protein [Phycisphaerae bacterium]